MNDEKSDAQQQVTADAVERRYSIQAPCETQSGRHMPIVLREGPYRFFFYSNERSELPDIHVQGERFLAKFGLHTASSKRFPSHELRSIQRIIEGRREEFLEAWNEHARR